MTPALRPHLLLLYQLDEALRPVLATPAAVDAWRFQLLEPQPGDRLATLKAEAEAQGANVFDTDSAIIISYRIPLFHALKAVDRVNRSLIIAAARRDQSERGAYR
jgi:hypothetical protein